MRKQSRKIFAVSDVHGHYTQMKTALDEAGFIPGCPEHLLVYCGDITDRGPENRKTVDYLDRLENKVLIRGNHEDMLLGILETGRFPEYGYLNGTDVTIGEFFGKYAIDGKNEVDFSGNNRLADRYCRLIAEMRDYYETERYVFVHGWLPADIGGKIRPDWRKAPEAAWQEARKTRWTDVYERGDRIDGKTIVCGHMPTFFAAWLDPDRPARSSDIFAGKGMIAIDAGTYSSGKVNVLVLEDFLLDG